ncbi:MAG: transporter substrate-binding domain-containing protein [Colwellia sp.]|nr:transporter substrate-binding domain-containing protein [Colwellia sp.]
MNTKQFFGLIINTLFCTLSSAETLTVMLFQDANPPYTIVKDGQYSGIFIDIFDKLSQVTPYTFIFKKYPAARALKEFDLGRVDIEPGINEIWRQNVKVSGEYSIVYETSKEVIVFKKNNFINLESPQDLYGKTIGIVRGYSYPLFDDAFKKNLIVKSHNRSEKLLLKQLQVERIKYIFIGYRTIKYFMQQNPQYQDLVIGNVVSHVNVKLRIHPSKAYILKDINKGLQELIDQGEIEAIYKKYQLP